MNQPAATQRAFRRWENRVFWGLLGLHLLPLWSNRYFLTCDGPAHLYNAWLLKAMLLHPGHVAHQVLAFNFNPEPNYLSHLLLGGLLVVFPPWLADKLVLTLYVAGLPLALRYLLRAVRPDAGWLVVLGFPFVYSMVLLWGFYNFCLSLVVLLWAVGYWLRRTGRGWRPGALVMLAGLLTLLFAAHPLSYLVSGLLLGLLWLAATLRRPPTGRPELGVLLLAYAPTLPLMAWYFWHKGTATAYPAQDYAGNLRSWLRLEPIHLAASPETAYRWLLAALFAGALAAAGWQLRRGAAAAPVLPWAGATLLLLGAYVMLPDQIAGGSIIQPRWGLLSYFTLLGGLAAVPWPRLVRLVGLSTGALVAGLLVEFRWQTFQAFQAGLTEYRSALPYLRPGATLLPLTYTAVTHIPGGPNLASFIHLFPHAASYLATEAQLLNYDNYEAEMGYFPLVWRPGRRPLTMSGDFPAHLEALLYEPAHQPTYVLLWGRTTARPNEPANAARIAQFISTFHYRLRFRSPAGLLELYEHPTSAAARRQRAVAASVTK